jgi:hypothetical protein
MNTPESSRCNIPKSSIQKMFDPTFRLPNYPVIYSYEFNRSISSLEGISLGFSTHSQPRSLKSRTTLEYLQEYYSDFPVVLSSSNSYSHGKIDSTLGDYLNNILKMENADKNSTLLANETYYLFGFNEKGIFKELNQLYASPPCHLCEKAGAKTPGIGGKNSGVSFHFHGSGFSEVIHGRKKWFLFPKEFSSLVAKIFHSNMTMESWHDNIYPYFHSESSLATTFKEEFIPDLEALKDHLFECTIEAGQVLYFPSFWMHATLNLEEFNFFYSHFLDSQLMNE